MARCAGALVGSVAVAVSSWVLGNGHRRLLDEAVFALHLIAALSLFAAAVIWLATAWKLVCGHRSGRAERPR